MAGEYKKIHKIFVKDLCNEILSSKQRDKNNNPYIDYPFYDFLKRIDFKEKVKNAGNNNRAIEEHLNMVAPEGWFFKVTPVDSRRAYRIKMIKKEVWKL
ncbi:MAG: hypothetical protein O8C61_10845 [Candidatus Methanoperedens sp.]|nr:hypothetical protein [Candidatus Methanoperedens sp.]